jgi:type IV secretory pathway TraG/TraD family ATPase VirD4
VAQGWRELSVFVFGPGRGKTSGLVARRVIEAPGANLMTSNKVDGVAEVIAGRRGRGEIYVFDPNQIYRHEVTPGFVYNPLWDVRSKADAEELAAIFEDSTRKNSDRGGDAHFDTDGRNLLAYCFLAAALDDIPLSTVYGWLAREEGHIPQEILRRHEHFGPATMIDGVDRSNDRTKNSVYVTARRMATALADDNLLAWTSAPDVLRPCLLPRQHRHHGAAVQERRRFRQRSPHRARARHLPQR